MKKTHDINVTCILSDEQLTRLQNITEVLKNYSKNTNWDDQMTLQLAAGNMHLVEIILILLENYVKNNIK
ncbi:MAG: hypothetical protein IJO65_04455 [Lachnospiraceae bacterium]|nr:hypothetical protein [Lachnospiraceae bacterium]